MTPPVTAFGAVLAAPARTAALLRAKASAAGMTLTAASELDLTAGVLAAHCWSVVTGRTALSGSMSPAQAAGLAAALARSAGLGQAPEEGVPVWSVPAPALSQRELAAFGPVVRWAVRQAGPGAVRLAAQDLSSCPEPRVAAAAIALAEWADQV